MNQEIEGIPERPEWPPYTDVGIEWDRDAWAYIQHLEAVERNLRESCEILKRMDSEKNRTIQHLEGEIGTLKEHLRRADKRMEQLEKNRTTAPDHDCEFCGKRPPYPCNHEAVTQQISPGPHFWHPQCRWLLSDGRCPRSLTGSCPDCGEESKGTRSDDGLYTYWKCQSCNWGDTQS